MCRHMIVLIIIIVGKRYTFVRSSGENDTKGKVKEGNNARVLSRCYYKMKENRGVGRVEGRGIYEDDSAVVSLLPFRRCPFDIQSI